MLSAGPIPYNSIHLLIITTEFVALYCPGGGGGTTTSFVRGCVATGSEN